ncbi:MAG: class I SAM-dependent methyltransferase [Caldilineaceae bacterium]
MSFSFRRWLGYTKWRCGQVGQLLAYRLPLPGSKRFIHTLWDNQAEMIHTQWGELEHDYAILGGLLKRYQPQSLIDMGCGSGRLFKLYVQYQIPTVVGVDISTRALAIARQRFPQIPTLHGRLEDLNFAPTRFDLAICNRVLQHIPAHAIQRVVTKLCTVARSVYINELTVSDNLSENFYMVRHKYLALFDAHAFSVLEEGQLGDQTYQVYTHQGRPISFRSAIDTQAQPLVADSNASAFDKNL